MDLSFIDRIDAAGTHFAVPESGIEEALRQGEAFKRDLGDTRSRGHNI
jgi:hypothetical protein